MSSCRTALMCVLLALLANCSAVPVYTTVFTLSDPPNHGDQLRVSVADLLLLFNVTANFTLETLAT
jgi:hypothetical protein